MNIQFLTEWLVSVAPEYSSSFLALWHEYIIAPDSVPKRIMGVGVGLLTVLSFYATGKKVGHFMLDVRKSWRLFDELCK